MLNYSSAGTASSSHLSGELFKALAGVQMVNIQYKNNSQETVDLLAGNVQLAFATASVVIPQVKAGKLRALAVTSAQPSVLGARSADGRIRGPAGLRVGIAARGLRARGNAPTPSSGA